MTAKTVQIPHHQILGSCTSCKMANKVAIVVFKSHEAPVYSLVTPRSVPFHLPPGVSQPYQTYFFSFKHCLIEKECNKNRLRVGSKGNVLSAKLLIPAPPVMVLSWAIAQPDLLGVSEGRAGGVWLWAPLPKR